LSVIRKPCTDDAAFDRVWQQVAALSGAYEMNPDRPDRAKEHVMAANTHAGPSTPLCHYDYGFFGPGSPTWKV
jgi:hypothetical protein